MLLPAPPAPDRSVDLGVAPLTRRQARQQERIRTASVPVITPELSAAYATQALVAGSEAASTEGGTPEREAPVDAADDHDPFAALGVTSGPIADVAETSADDDTTQDAVEEPTLEYVAEAVRCR